MKPSQRQCYAERIERVVRHLETIDPEAGAPSLADLAGIASMSEFHFHRIFRLMTGETVGEIVRRLRLARTLPALSSGITVTDAAGASGYSTTQSFARALRAQTGMSATSARAATASLEALAARLRRPAASSDGSSPPIGVEVVSVEPFRLLAVRNVGDYAELNRGYGRLFELVIGQVGFDAIQGIYGVPYDDPRFTVPEICRFDCALSVGAAGAASGDLFEMTLGSGTFLRYRHLGSYDRLHESIDNAYAAAIIDLDCEVDDRPFFVHYLDDPESKPEAELRTDIYLPLRSQTTELVSD